MPAPTPSPSSSFQDSDGDDLLISDDASLTEAVDHARAQGDVALKVMAKFVPRAVVSAPNAGMGGGMGSAGAGAAGAATATSQEAAPMDPKVVYGVAAAAAVALTVTAIFMRKR